MSLLTSGPERPRYGPVGMHPSGITNEIEHFLRLLVRDYKATYFLPKHLKFPGLPECDYPIWNWDRDDESGHERLSVDYVSNNKNTLIRNYRLF